MSCEIRTDFAYVEKGAEIPVLGLVDGERPTVKYPHPDSRECLPFAEVEMPGNTPEEYALFGRAPVIDVTRTVKLDLKRVNLLLGGDKFDSIEKIQEVILHADEDFGYDANLFTIWLILAAIQRGEEKELKMEVRSLISLPTNSVGGNAYNSGSAVLEESKRFVDGQAPKVSLNNDEFPSTNSTTIGGDYVHNRIFTDGESKIVIRGGKRFCPSLEELRVLTERMGSTMKSSVLHMTSLPREIHDYVDPEGAEFSGVPMGDCAHMIDSLSAYRANGGKVYLQYSKGMVNLSPDQLAELVSTSDAIVLNKEEYERTMSSLLRAKNVDSMGFNFWVTDGGNPTRRIYKVKDEQEVNEERYSVVDMGGREKVSVTGAGDTFTGILLLLISMGYETKDAVDIARRKVHEVIASPQSELSSSMKDLTERAEGDPEALKKVASSYVKNTSLLCDLRDVI